MRTWQVENMNQNCDMTNFTSSNTSKSYRYPVKTESLPERWGAVPRCLLATQTKQQTSFNIYQEFIPHLSPSSNKWPNHNVFFKEWSWQRKFFTWLGELLAGSGPKWRMTSNPTDGKKSHWLSSMKGTGFSPRLFWCCLWCYQKERSYSLRVLGVCVV